MIATYLGLINPWQLKFMKFLFEQVFGHGHPKTVRAIKTISDPRYQRMLQAEERQAAGVA